MKKLWLFTLSTFIALTIAFYSKHPLSMYSGQGNPAWKTFEKKSNNLISGHTATVTELAAARIPLAKREIAHDKNQYSDSFSAQKRNMNYQYREDRILIGDVQKNNYQDESVELEMINRPSSNWKDLLGNDLIRFQYEDTKVMIKEEYSVIKIQSGRGLYAEQVLVTFFSKNGNTSSYRALVDAESGQIIETWDKTIHDNVRSSTPKFTLPAENNSGIIAR
ncbi:MAG: hypothetical protein WC635_15425 [Bacteriovorax sp.]|jgi:hypothetical protein